MIHFVCRTFVLFRESATRLRNRFRRAVLCAETTGDAAKLINDRILFSESDRLRRADIDTQTAFDTPMRIHPVFKIASSSGCFVQFILTELLLIHSVLISFLTLPIKAEDGFCSLSP